MKWTKKLPYVAFLAFAVTSCLPVFYPLYTTDTMMIDDRIKGWWADPYEDQDDPSFWQIKRHEGDEHYTCRVFIDSVYAYDYELYLVNLGDTIFYDLKMKADLFGNGPAGVVTQGIAPMMPMHSLGKIQIGDRQVNFNPFNYDRITKLLSQRKIRIKHETDGDDNYLITAKTDELQAFCEKYATREDFFMKFEDSDFYMNPIDEPTGLVNKETFNLNGR